MSIFYLICKTFIKRLFNGFNLSRLVIYHIKVNLRFWFKQSCNAIYILCRPYGTKFDPRAFANKAYLYKIDDYVFRRRASVTPRWNKLFLMLYKSKRIDRYKQIISFWPRATLVCSKILFMIGLYSSLFGFVWEYFPISLSV